MLNEQMTFLIPSAIYALCIGFVPFTQCFKEVPLAHNYFDVTDAQDDSHKFEDPKYQCVLDFLDCSVEVLAEIEKMSKVEATQVKICPPFRVSRETSDKLLHEMETSILGALVEEEINKRHLPDTLLICSLLSNLLYGCFFTSRSAAAVRLLLLLPLLVGVLIGQKGAPNTSDHKWEVAPGEKLPCAASIVDACSPRTHL
ncbi:hypothetical protein LR48_Vigan04g060300 [Vigna angularis]|uniref:Uncharacterized protein n=1 Tax=Phaseolus angularis TaxID=3914 RepID=A0A0L9UBT4_PHAAN|nr:hypothetical protein LR48_Vigan04g060300 [Vigna angularis]